MTKAQEFVTEELKRLLGKGSKYRAAALLLTYPSEKEGMACQIAMGSALAKADIHHAMDFVQLVKALRRLADELELRIAGKVSLTQEIVDDGRDA